jgi:multisubunit Na+/H+ antiporter MnhB subunit
MSTVLSSGIARLLLPITFIGAAALLVKGYGSVGDGFSAGVTAACGVLLQYLAFKPQLVEELFPVRYSINIAMAGLSLAFVVVFWPAVFGMNSESLVTPPSGRVLICRSQSGLRTCWYGD